MTHRPVDENGDILPAVRAADLLTGAEALAASLREHLWHGGWWEDPDRASPLTDAFDGARLTPAGAEALAADLAAWLTEHPSVDAVQDAAVRFDGRRVAFTFTVLAEGASLPVSAVLYG